MKIGTILLGIGNWVPWTFLAIAGIGLVILLIFLVCEVGLAFALSMFLVLMSVSLKLDGDPKGELETTDNFWLAAVSPYHQVPDLQYRNYRPAKSLRTNLLVATELVLLAPSLVVSIFISIPWVLKEFF